MDIQTYIKVKLRERGMNQTELANLAGFKNQSNVATLLKKGKTMKMDNLFALLNALDCELIVRDCKTNETKVISKELI